MDTARETLYGGAPETFVATRRDLARQARAAKDRDLARRIEGLRKPSRSAWLVNQLARDPDTDLEQLLSLAPQLAQMHTTGSPEQLRELTTLRRRAVAALVARAVAVGRSHDVQVTEQTRREVETCLEAALGHPEAAAQVLRGSLVRAPETAAAFPMDLFELPAVPSDRPTPQESSPPLAPVIPMPVDEAAREQARAERERERARRAAEREAELARARALAARLQELENRLAGLEAEVAEASRALTEAAEAVAAAIVRREEAARTLEELAARRDATQAELDAVRAGSAD